LRNGDGVPKNVVESTKYYKLSADQGFASGQYAYGFALKNGEGVSKNLGEAAKYFKLSADQGNAKAKAELGAS
jgi:TPR repeat protein